MFTGIYLSQLHCQRCRTFVFVSHIEKEAEDWIATCPSCGAQNIIALSRINNVSVVSPALRVVGLRT